MAAGLGVWLLGGVEAARDGTPAPVPGTKAQALMALLALAAPHPVSGDRLIEELWGDEQPANPANALQAQVSQLRRQLGAEAVVRRGSGYALAAPADAVDVHRFEALVEAGRAAMARADAREAVEQFQAALALVRGPALGELTNFGFAREAATRLAELELVAHEGLADAKLAEGRHAEVMGAAAALVRAHPLRERFHAQLILALYRGGRQADALRAYQDARAALVEELGIEPGPELQALERAVLAQDPVLDLQPPPRSARAVPKTAGAVSPEPGPGGGASAVGAATSTADDLAEAWRAARAEALPAPLTPMVGREAELARAGELLRTTRVLTLTGPGGAGKTRLALEVARAWPDDEHVWFVDLGALADAERVAVTLAAVVGVPTAPDEDPSVVLARALVRERGLLVLDTCEHVLMTVADLVIQLLGACPDVRVLATSRRPFGITGETAWPVPPLAVPPTNGSAPAVWRLDHLAAYPSVALFRDRAAAVRPGFELSDANAHQVAAICAALDGLPLAIELAAARADVLTPAAIHARLQHRFDLLVDGGRQASARQQTLRAAIDWSFGLLTDDERAFFVRLGAFAGSFDLDAAMAVAGDGLADPLSLLAALVRHSMVVTAGEDRYRLLDSLRVYAIEALDGADRDGPPGGGARRRHAVHYAALAGEAERGILGADELAWLARLRADVPNFRAAVEWSLGVGEDELAAAVVGALGWFWTLEGMLAEAVDLADRAAALTGLSPLARAKVLTSASLLAASLGRLEVARPWAAEAAARADEAGDTFAAARALHALAITAWAVGDFDAASAAHDRAIAGLSGRTEPWVLGRLGLCMAMRARTARDAGDTGTAPLLDAALATARRAGAQDIIGLVLEQIARERLAADDPGAAVEAARECLAMHEAIGYTEGVMSALHTLARSMTAVGSMQEAGVLHRRALALSSRIGHVAGTCEAMEGLAVVAASADDHVVALTLVEVAGRERHGHGVGLRGAEEAALVELRRAAEDALGEPKATEVASRARLRPAADVVAELLATS
jgi:predicted ATPase/DNA-binding SARP family transcriptional activator